MGANITLVAKSIDRIATYEIRPYTHECMKENQVQRFSVNLR